MEQALRRACAVLGIVAIIPLTALAASPASDMGSSGPMRMGGMGSMGGKSGGMCPMMGKMGGGGSIVVIPTLPPGNEAAQLRMNGEILRAVGKIEQKYASKVHDR